MLYLNWQPVQNSHKATLFASSKNAGGAVAVYNADTKAVSLVLRDWHVALIGLPTSTGLRGAIPGGFMPEAMRTPQADTRLHVRQKDRDEATGDC